MILTAAGEDDPGAQLDSPNGRFHAYVITESVWTTDGRWFENLEPRPGLLPLMADDKTHDAHLESTLVANFDTWEKRDNQWHGWGAYLSPPTDEAALASESWQRASYLIEQIKTGKLPGISCDVEPIQFEVLFPVMGAEAQQAIEEGEPAPENETETDDDGQEFEVVPMDQMIPKLRVTEGRLMGATALPFPAFDGDEAFIEDDSGVLVASAALIAAGSRNGGMGAMVEPDLAARGTANGGVVAAGTVKVRGERDTRETVIPLAGREGSPARFSFPEIPPREWFEVPETPGPMPLTILDSGQVFGHLALWGECHIGISGECVEPPPSSCSYARFHVGEIPVAPEGRVAVGRLTFATGHADTKLGANEARSHYDNTGSVGADVRAVDGEYGIWLCGAARSTLSTAQVREVMSSPPSGDWRRWGSDLELVGALCVNVPGFNTPRERILASGLKVLEPVTAVRVRKDDGLIASLIVSHPASPNDRRVSNNLMLASGLGLDGAAADRIIERIATTIGRSTDQRIAAARERVNARRR